MSFDGLLTGAAIVGVMLLANVLIALHEIRDILDKQRPEVKP